MSDEANKLLTDFLKEMPDRTRGHVAFVAMMLIRPDIELGPETDFEALAFESINPPRGSGTDDPSHGAAVIWAGLLDYVFERVMPPPTSAEMHEIADKYRAEHGAESDQMRAMADQQDGLNADFDAAANRWRDLRAGPFSVAALRLAWWNRERN
jgi:hypothetical protein